MGLSPGKDESSDTGDREEVKDFALLFERVKAIVKKVWDIIDAGLQS